MPKKIWLKPCLGLNQEAFEQFKKIFSTYFVSPVRASSTRGAGKDGLGVGPAASICPGILRPPAQKDAGYCEQSSSLYEKPACSLLNLFTLIMFLPFLICNIPVIATSCLKSGFNLAIWSLSVIRYSSSSRVAIARPTTLPLLSQLAGIMIPSTEIVEVFNLLFTVPC